MADRRNTQRYDITMHVFIQYLASRDLLNIWINHILYLPNNREYDLYENNNCMPENAQDFVTYMPAWGETKQGSEFWFNVSKDWHDVLRICKNIDIVI